MKRPPQPGSVFVPAVLCKDEDRTRTHVCHLERGHAGAHRCCGDVEWWS